nr:DUF1353 domain-containing protein [uncultured Arsenicibacter sp.]
MTRNLFFFCFVVLLCATAFHGQKRHFSGDIRIEPLVNNGSIRVLRVKAPFAFIDTAGKIWVVPQNVLVDSTSLPQQVRQIAGSPYTAAYRNAFVVHKYHCDHKQETWQAVHRMFFEACLTTGADEHMAKTMYAAMYAYGPRWETKFVIDYEAGVRKRIVTTYETLYPEAAFADDRQWINDTNPSLTAIDARIKEKLTFAAIRTGTR